MEEILAIKNIQDWLLSRLYESQQSPEDNLRVLKALKKYVSNGRDIFYSIEFIGDNTIRLKPLNDMADDFLICVSLFQEHIDSLHSRRNTPSVGWYEDLCSASFRKLGFDSIASNIYFWEKFIRYRVFSGFDKAM